MNKRKLYEKPQVRAIKLVPEEAVLAPCKAVGGAGGKSNKCGQPACKNTTGS